MGFDCAWESGIGPHHRGAPRPGNPAVHARWLAALCSLALSVGCGPGDGDLGAGASVGADTRPITNGTPDTTPSHAAVVALVLGPRLCSGTLIAPRVVLTAAHCVRGITAAQTQVGFGTDLRNKQTQWVKVAALQPNPKYDPQLLINDVALVELASPAPDGVAPIPILPNAMALGKANVGETLVFAGFGTTSGATVGTAGTKLEVTASLDFVCPGPGPCDFAGARASPETLCYNQQPGGPCMGDSGGPAFVTINGQEYVAGITSYGDPLCTSYGCSTKIDAFEGFVSSFLSSVAAAAGAACSTASECQSGFCVSGVCCDKACTGAPCETCLAAQGATKDGVCTSLSGSCEDGNACTTNKQCREGACVGEPLAGCVVPTCTVKSCDATGACTDRPLEDGTACDDGNACTVADSCRAGGCVGTLPPCPVSGACAGACTNPSRQRHAGCGYGDSEPMIILATATLIALRPRRGVRLHPR